MASRPETRRRASDHARWKARRETAGLPVPETAAPLVSPDQLSQRQRDVLTLVAQGLNNDAIAYRLFLSADTVRNHLTTIYRRLGVRNRTEAARVYWAAQRGG